MNKYLQCIQCAASHRFQKIIFNLTLSFNFWIYFNLWTISMPVLCWKKSNNIYKLFSIILQLYRTFNTQYQKLSINLKVLWFTYRTEYTLRLWYEIYFAIGKCKNLNRFYYSHQSINQSLNELPHPIYYVMLIIMRCRCGFYDVNRKPIYSHSPFTISE